MALAHSKIVSAADKLRIYLPAIIFCCSVVSVFQGRAQAQAPSLQELKSLWTVAAKDLKTAGELFRQNKFDECKQTVESVMIAVAAIPTSADPAVTMMQQKVHKGLDRARELLKLQGIEIQNESGTNLEPTTTGAAGTSFVRDVVPIIMDKCGGCHVQRAAGEVTLATYDALIAPNGTGVGIVVPENVDESYFLKVIIDGDMPKGKKKITADELDTLKKWVMEGAKFDGSDASATLDTLTEAS